MNANHPSRIQRGFTLIELVIVLAVLGALAAIAVPQLTGLQDRAELAGTATTVSSEAGNLFARELANGNTNGNWTDASAACTYVASNAAATSSSSYSLQNSAPGNDDDTVVTVPTYDSSTNEVGSAECYLTR
ncbi:type II secretion system protein [Spiribacter curvatus]|uniref:type II secretion system protein n=1 Tax=Spiribacter curvatus TaxID=1335757 RepID=UPI00097748C5|nr:prepilin-type N-terminal cleavage/methylation domain-containing protein [Spiribacter curvatus]